MPSKHAIQNLRQILTQVGLSESEAAFYLANIQLGQASVRRIASHAGLNRTSSYSVFESLKSRGILSSIKKSGRIVLESIDPQRLLERQKDRLQSVESHLHELNELFRLAKREPNVKYYQGKDGLKQVLKGILLEAKDICIFGDGDAFRRAIPGWTETYSMRRKQQGIKARILLRATSDAIAIIKQRRQAPSETKFRVLPEAANVVGGFDVFGHKTVLYSFDETNMAIVIDSPLISKMMQSIFELLWSSAEAYEKTLLR